MGFNEHECFSCSSDDAYLKDYSLEDIPSDELWQQFQEYRGKGSSVEPKAPEAPVPAAAPAVPVDMFLNF